ncbi:conserved hypothetical protein [Vibrio chagasii]|uniref:TcfC E-set like domain-containing protein n=1 Tax=Vibrio TaxID=662 RepID=UPI000E325EE1|nr:MULTISPECIES: TcfC E-set like domain-containing protein [Vibrio]MCG9561351.1 TcfC E-set like domain-containing protein [Vibrio chagasii]MCG9673668.1 TcfC E-set like domain-containing protein [Vibrio chagasii]CAH6938976.1 conserved hypothetical protein [Vibrio chagasii]CAH6954177.1 conserved hypothetical protein [Vibrio chagasii]CAH6989895.1 conserved hypothetical protein [Vibrio chagasii]
MKSLKKSLIILNSVFLTLYSGVSHCKDIPVGFENVFEVRKIYFRMRNLDGTLTEPVEFEASFNSLQLNPDNKKSVKFVTDYLENNNISRKYEKRIVDELITGVDGKSDCKGRLEKCELSPEDFDIVYNYNDREIYLFVSEKILTYSDSSELSNYHSSKSEQNGLINSFDFYVSKYNNQGSSLSLNDETVLGLPYGYFSSDLNVNNSNSGSELYEAAYNLDVESYSLKVGHFEFEPEINSTDFLNNTARIAQNSITIGTSKKLLVGGYNNDKQLSFYASSSGSVQVYRDGRLIYQDNISEGVNSIAYTKLPPGRYEVTLEVTTSGNIINRQTYQVYNTTSDSLTLGEVDFVVTSGMFSGSHYDYEESGIVNIEGDLYGKVLSNYQLTPSLQIGLGGLITDMGSMYSIGGVYNLIEWDLNSEAVYSKFEDSTHLNVNIAIPYLSLSYESLDNSLGDPVASYMYGFSDYSRLSLNTSYNFVGGQSIYGIYSLTKDDSPNALEGASEQEQSFFSAGFSTPSILNSTININVDYAESTGDASFNFLWSVPLSDTVETVVGFVSDTHDIDRFKTVVRENQLVESESFNTSLELSNTYDRQQPDMYQEARFATSGKTKYARLNATANTSTNGINGINAGISSTQIITKDGAYVTDETARAYTLVDVEPPKNTDDGVHAKGYLSLKKEGKASGKFIVYNNETIIPLQDYNQYQARFDSESLDLYNFGNSEVSVFTHPGSVASIKPRVNRTVSFISAFDDIKEQPVSNVECHGRGCIDVSKITDGIFRITVLDGMDFELSANRDRCLLPYKFVSKNQLNFGKNYCLPINPDQKIAIGEDGDILYAMYLGSYERSSDFEQAVNKIESRGYKIVQKDVGPYKATYIVSSSKDLDEKLKIHQEEINNLKSLAKRLYVTESITYPIAKSH